MPINQAPMHIADKDLTLDTPHGYLNVRVGFVVIQDDKVLLHKSPDGFWFLPGGRIAFGEASLDAAYREVAEELQIQPNMVELAGIIENFFHFGARDFHELMFIYRVSFDQHLTPPANDIGGAPIESGWMSAAELSTIDLKPTLLKERLFSFTKGVQHIMHKDKAS